MCWNRWTEWVFVDLVVPRWLRLAWGPPIWDNVLCVLYIIALGLLCNKYNWNGPQRASQMCELSQSINKSERVSFKCNQRYCKKYC